MKGLSNVGYFFCIYHLKALSKVISDNYNIVYKQMIIEIELNIYTQKKLIYE